MLFFAFFFAFFLASFAVSDSLVELASLWHFRQNAGLGISPGLSGFRKWYFEDLTFPQLPHTCLVAAIVTFKVVFSMTGGAGFSGDFSWGFS